MPAESVEAFAESFQEQLSYFFDRYFTLRADVDENGNDHLRYLFSEFSAFGIVGIMQLTSKERKEAVIERLCHFVKHHIEPAERRKQKAYIILLSDLLLQSQFFPSRQIRKAIMDAVFSTNCYPEQLLAYQELTERDSYFIDYPKQEYMKSLKVIEGTDALFYPPLLCVFSSRFPEVCTNTL